MKPEPRLRNAEPHEGERIVGAISVVPENELDGFNWSVKSDARELARVVVAPELRGRRLGGFMVESLLPILAESGVTAIHLSAAKANLPACKTYERLGFTRVGEASLYGRMYYLYEYPLPRKG